MIYLATRYSSGSVTDEELEQRYRRAVEITAKLIEAGYVVVSPIVLSHPISKLIGHKTDVDFWMEKDRILLAACHIVVVAADPLWNTSKGVKMEIKLARKLHIPVLFCVEKEGRVDMISERHFLNPETQFKLIRRKFETI